MRSVPARLGNVYVLLGVQAAVLVALLFSVNDGRWHFPAYRVDLDVYRLGSSALLHGDALYGALPATQDGQHLLFTYPPFAAIVLAPLALLPYWLACFALTVISLGLLAVVLMTVLRVLGIAPTGPRRWGRFVALLLAAELLEPILRTVYAGQVDLLLLALVVLDVLADTPPWPRGLLIGIAAAIKLTPLVFLLYFLLRRDTRAALTAGLTFVAATAAGFLLAGADSVRYWTGAVWDTGRVGGPAYAGDQSLLGVLARLGIDAPGRTVCWLVLVAGTVVVTALGMRRMLAAGHTAHALGLNAVCGLLISPISWTHHWVWIVVVLPAWAHLVWRTRQRWAITLAGGGLVLFLAAPQWWWPRGGVAETQWNVFQQLTGNGYVLFGVALLVVAATSRIPEDSLRRSESPARTNSACA